MPIQNVTSEGYLQQLFCQLVYLFVVLSWAFVLYVFYCQETRSWSGKAHTFNNNGLSLKTSAYFYSILCNILNVRIATTLY
jgi:hypothetical protein